MKSIFSQGLYNEKEVAKPSFKEMPPFDAKNVQCFMDIEIGNKDDEEK